MFLLYVNEYSCIADIFIVAYSFDMLINGGGRGGQFESPERFGGHTHIYQ